MKLCNYRWPRNQEGCCGLQVDQIQAPLDSSGQVGRWGGPLVFQGVEGNHQWIPRSIICAERMSEICPYRRHTPKPRFPVMEHKNLQGCSYCRGRHYSQFARIQCRMLTEFKDKMSAYCVDGTKDAVFSDVVLNYSRFADARARVWPSMAYAIYERDGKGCQICGLGEKDAQQSFECHHIIPRGLGGTDHPANLQTVCPDCHKRFNEKFNGRIISKKARERKIKVLQQRMKTLDEIERKYPREE